MEGLTVETFSNTINQEFLQFAVGPQLNFSLSDKLWISPIVQAGYFRFNQDELILTQESNFKDDLHSTEVFRQDEVSEGGFFIKPALQLSYQIAKHWNIWGETSYFVAEVSSTQNQLVPFGDPNDQGQYFFDQVIRAVEKPRFDTKESETKFNNFGVSFGIGYSFGNRNSNDSDSSKAGDYNSVRSNKPTRSSGSDANIDRTEEDNNERAQDYNSVRSNKPTSTGFTNVFKEQKERRKPKQKLVGILPENNSTFEDVGDIKNFTWELVGKEIPNPQFIIEVTSLRSNQQPTRSYSAKTSKTSISAREVFKGKKAAEGQYQWKVLETNTGTTSSAKFFSLSSCEIDLSISNEEIECLGYEGNEVKYRICFDSNYSSTSGDLEYTEPNSGLFVFDQNNNPLVATLVNPNTSLVSQSGTSLNTVSYCFEVTVDPSTITEIGFGLQGDDLDPSPIVCQPGANLIVDDLPDCICDECENIELSFDEYTISMNGSNGNEFDINGNLNVNVPIYGIEVQVQSYSYSANPSACTDGVSSVEESGMILMPGTTINGSTSLQLANENVSGSPNSNTNATKNISYSSSSGLTGAIPMNLTIGLPGPLPGLDSSCCEIDYSVCIKIRIIYDENDCKSCVFTHCFTFNNL